MNDLRDLSCLCSNDFGLCQMNLNDGHEQFCADHELPRFLLGEYIDWTKKVSHSTYQRESKWQFDYTPFDTSILERTQTLLTY